MKKTVHSAVSVILLAGLVTGLLTACSLAAEDGVLENGGDRLVGMFLTTEYVDTVDWDSVDVSAMMDGKTGSGGEKKIYGTFDQEQGEYVFEGLEGYSLGVMKLKDKDGEAYFASVASDCFSDVKLNMSDQENTCSGILYFDQTRIRSGGLILYGNAVYEIQDGTVYLIPGTGVQITDVEGDWFVTLSDTATEVNNGKKTETKNTFQATYRGVCPVQAVKFSWQDENGKVLKEEIYEADEIPAFIKWGENTAYIIAALQNGDGTADYNLIGRDDESCTLHLTADSLILKNVEVAVER